MTHGVDNGPERGEPDADSTGLQPENNAVTWRWLFTDQVGLEMTGPDVVFESQSAAEHWLQENFEMLAEDGVATVSLLNGGHAVYGPMYLTPEGGGPAADAEL
jgi:hypothetical protein